MAKVTWSDAAIAGVEEIRAYIKQHNPRAAARLGAQLLNAGESLGSMPQRGTRVEGGRRKLVMSPYVIFYQATPDGTEVVITAVVDGRRLA